MRFTLCVHPHEKKTVFYLNLLNLREGGRPLAVTEMIEVKKER